jgi:LuxR family maltose regulon positive regulatory protein
MAALTGQLAEAERRLRESVALRSPADLPADIRAVLALLRSNIALSGHDPHVIETFAREALEQLHPAQAHYDIWRAVAVRNSGIAALQRKDLPTAQQALDEAARLGVASNNLFLALAALGVLGRVQLHSGQLGAALQTGERTLAIGAQQRSVPLAAGIASIGIGEASCERNELEAAIHYLRRGIELLTQQSVELYALARGYVALARAQHAQGQAEAALSTLRHGIDWLVQAAVSSPRAGVLLAAHQARLQLWRGDHAAAASWAAGRQLNNNWTPVIDPGIDECLTLVRVVIAQRNPGLLGQALRVLNQLAHDAETASLLGVLIEIELLRALALQVQGNLAAALPALEAALTLAAPEGYVRLFVDEGAPMAALLAQVARDESSIAAYAATLLQAFPDFGLQNEPPTQHPTSNIQLLVESLSERELEILRLIAEGHSNQAIADQLVVAVSTVKKHINNLYGKLDVQSRTQALVRARQLNLL